MTVTVPVEFKLTGQPARQIAAINNEAKALSRTLTGLGSDLEVAAFTRDLKRASEGLHELRLAAEETVEQLFVFGDAGSQTVSVIEGVSDLQTRIQLGQQALQGPTNALAKGLTGVQQGLATAHARAAVFVGGAANLELLLGGVGIAAGIATTALLGFGQIVYEIASTSLKTFIASNKEATQTLRNLEHTQQEVLKSLGKTIYEYGELDKLLRGTNAALATNVGGWGDVLLALVGISPVLRENVRLLGEERILLETLASSTGFQSVVEVLKFFAAVEKESSDASKKLAQDLVQVNSATDVFAATAKGAAEGGVSTFTQAIDYQSDALIFLQSALRGVGETLDEVAQKASKATPYLTGLEAGEATGASQARAGLRRRGGAGGRRFQTFTGAAGAIQGTAAPFGGGPEAANLAALRGIGGASSAASGLGPEGFVDREALLGFLDLARVVEREKSASGTGQRKEQAAENTQKHLSDVAFAVQGYEALTAVIRGLEGAATSAGAAFGGIVQGLANGSIKAKDFGKATKTAFGDLFVQLGQGYIQQGIVMTLTGNPVGLAVTAGGVALVAVGGALQGGGKGGGNSSAVTGAAAVSSATRLATPALERERDKERTFILRVGDRDLQTIVTDLVSDGQRRGMGGGW